MVDGRGLFDFLDDARDLRQAAHKFHRENPEVYEAFERFALEAIRSGRTRLGVAMIWERLRWYTAIETSGEPFWKLNNNHRAYYARMFIERHPEHENVFETRSVRS